MLVVIDGKAKAMEGREIFDQYLTQQDGTGDCIIRQTKVQKGCRVPDAE